MLYRKDNHDGFTLIETLIYIAVIGGMAISFITFSLSITGSRNKTYVAQEVQANSRFALNIISRTIKTAIGINTSTSVFNLDPGVLSLSMASSSLNPTIISLDQNDGILSVKKGTDDPINITSNKIQVTNLVFSNFTTSGSSNIGIDLTIAYKNTSNDVYYNYAQDIQTAVSFRK